MNDANQTNICEPAFLAARVAALEDVLTTTLGNIRSLKYTADAVQRTNVFDVWERIVMEALKCPEQAPCFECGNLVLSSDDDALLCIECGGRNRRWK